MAIKGFLPTSLIDYPQKIAAVLFFSGCNFRCPYCHNHDLVLNFDTLPSFDLAAILLELQIKNKFLDGVVLTGGEPLLHKDLPSIISQIKEISGMQIKLDTNGYLPEKLNQLLEDKKLNYIAMDIKTSSEKYWQAAGLDQRKNPDIVQRIKKSIALMAASGIEHEFRTTLVPAITDQESIISVCRLLPSESPYYLQPFSNERTLDRQYLSLRPFSEQKMQKLLTTAKRYHAKSYLRS